MIRNESISYNRFVIKLFFVILLFSVLTGCAGISGNTTNTQVMDSVGNESDTQGSEQSDRADETSGKMGIASDTSDVDDEDDDLFFDDDDDLFDDEDIETQAASEISDPLYYFNKAMFHFNDKMYFWVVKPVATGYRSVTPTIVRKGVSNFFHNLATPIRLVNNTLQGKIKGAGSELARFLLNSTLGILGFGDPAKKYMGLNPSNEDLGQTLGKYGIGNGPYVVWPVFGPSTLRDTIGLTGDYFLNPVSYVEPELLSTGIKTTDKINAASFRIGDYEAFKKAYLDPYERMKEFYIDHRKSKVAE